MKCLRSNNKGFSLVEVLVALGVSSIILLGVATFMRASGNSYKTVTSQVSLQNETQDIMNYITSMVQASSDAGWKDGVFYVLQPDALKATTAAKSKEPDYIVHALKYDKANTALYYKRVNITNANFTLSSLTSVKNDLAITDNLISTKISAFEAIVERYAALPTPKPDGSAGTDAPDSRTQSLSKVDFTIEICNNGDFKLTKASVRPRNLITAKYFYKVGFDVKTANSSYTPPTKVLARPNGDVEIGTDGYPKLN